MAHQIDTVSLGRASYASTQKEWHFGQTQHAVLQPGAPVEEWAVASGMNYRVQRASVRYATERLTPDAQLHNLKVVDDKIVLFRSDTGAPLGIVSDGYQIMQPLEVLEFFREWAERNACVIESAGVLFGGKRYFATAKMAQAVALASTGGDTVVPYILLSTSADGSLSTEGRLTGVRTVCNNTLTAARNGAATLRVTHRSKFDAAQAKSVMETAREDFAAFMEMARQLTAIKVESARAEEMTTLLLTTPARNADAARESAGFQRIMGLFNGLGRGAELETAKETAWGWLNAVTEYVDHHARARSDENRTASAIWGPGADLKAKAVQIVQSV